MKKIYVITGYGYTPKKAYTTQELAEKACEQVQEWLECSGCLTRVSVEELELVEQ